MRCVHCDAPIEKGQWVTRVEQVTWVGKSLVETTMLGLYAHVVCPETKEN